MHQEQKLVIVIIMIINGRPSSHQ